MIMKMKLFLLIAIVALAFSCKTAKHSKSSDTETMKTPTTNQSVQSSQGDVISADKSQQAQSVNAASSSSNGTSFEIMKKSPNLKNLSELSAFFDMLDITYYPDLVNDPVNAHNYKNDEKKTAANMGVYLGDMVYVMGSEGYIEAYKNFGAAMELAHEVGIEDNFPNLVIDRYEGKAPKDSVMMMLDDALNKSEKHLSANDKVIFYDFMLYGNYIEKLHIISGLLAKATESDLPDAATADLKRNLLIFMAKQRKPLEKAYEIMSPYFDNSPKIINKKELEDLIDMYKELEVNKDKILKLDPINIYKAKEVKAIEKQIDVLRNRIIL